jgi:hypothetical protein
MRPEPEEPEQAQKTLKRMQYATGAGLGTITLTFSGNLIGPALL